jgi:predicted nucleotidyltransferase
MTPTPDPSDARLDLLVRVVAGAQADVVLIGGVAMSFHGANYVTFDLDLCYRRDPATIARLCEALAPYSATLRGALLDHQNVLLTENVGLETDFGHLDLMGHISGLGDYEQVLAHALPVEVDGQRLMVLGLDGLIRAKEAAGRDKDLLHLATLRALRAMRDE